MNYKKYAIQLIFILLTVLIVYTRFIGLDWGLPYPMHPDERNMAIAILQLQCTDITSTTCFHPHFFAYGQFPLYISYGIAQIYQYISIKSTILTFDDVTLALRTLSALAGVVTVLYLFKIVEILVEKISQFQRILIILLFIFVPAFIQFSHFGTTESLLMMFYTLLFYNAVALMKGKITLSKYTIGTGILLGLAMGTKVSALLFISIPGITLLSLFLTNREEYPFMAIVFSGVKIAAVSIVFFILSSPYNLIAWSDFRGSMDYESAVGLGTYKAFYTRQFEYSLPYIFQFVRIFPYALGGPLFVLFLCSFFFLPYKREYIVMRILFLIFFLPTAAIYAKWTRFISPIFPLMMCMTTVFFASLVQNHEDKLLQKVVRIVGVLILIVTILPGIAYLSIYTAPDVRFVASKWIYEHMNSGSKILSETANVIDVPIPNKLLKTEDHANKNYIYVSFNSYDVDIDTKLQTELSTQKKTSPYVFIPSRRVVYNHTCYRPVHNSFKRVSEVLGYESYYCQKMKTNYPVLNSYYDELFAENSAYKKVAEFTSYPRIHLFGFTLFELPDEASEETWTVFDHPVIRIYSKM